MAVEKRINERLAELRESIVTRYGVEAAVLRFDEAISAVVQAGQTDTN